MKKISFFLCLIFSILSIQFPVNASNVSYSWYCAHRKNNLQPQSDKSVSFIENYDAFYIDKDHSDNNSKKKIYLTFDAGYDNGNVTKILNVLREEKVHAAFFVLGHLIDHDTALVKRMFDEGHLVCNHTFSHKAMVGKNKEEFTQELNKLEKKCISATGRELSKYYRPPEGRFDEISLQYAQEMGYKTVFWSFAYDDWDNNRQMNAENAKRKIIENLHNGEIMLLHPTSSTNAEILKDIISEIRASGYEFGCLDDIKV